LLEYSCTPHQSHSLLLIDKLLSRRKEGHPPPPPIAVSCKYRAGMDDPDSTLYRRRFLPPFSGPSGLPLLFFRTLGSLVRGFLSSSGLRASVRLSFFCGTVFRHSCPVVEMNRVPVNISLYGWSLHPSCMHRQLFNPGPAALESVPARSSWESGFLLFSSFWSL